MLTIILCVCCVWADGILFLFRGFRVSIRLMPSAIWVGLRTAPLVVKQSQSEAHNPERPAIESGETATKRRGFKKGSIHLSVCNRTRATRPSSVCNK